MADRISEKTYQISDPETNGKGWNWIQKGISFWTLSET